MGTQRRAPSLSVTVTCPPTARRSVAGLGPWLARVAPKRATGEVAIALVSATRVRALNAAYRGSDAATDVLSFPADSSHLPSAGILGDIVIALDVARRQAKAAGHALGTEVRVLALHGLLHLLGYDHESDHGQMARIESRLRKQGGLREGLIARAQASCR